MNMGTSSMSVCCMSMGTSSMSGNSMSMVRVVRV